MVTSGVKFENIDKLIADLDKGDNFAVGARWIQKYIVNNAGEFKGATITFEETQRVGETVRRIDVMATNSVRTKIYYEFKSVETVPPTNFAEQFMKDLQLTDVDDLSQIKWIFDGSKNPANFNKNMLDAIEKLPLTENLALKFVGRDNIIELRQMIKNSFNKIFKLSN